MNDIKTMKSGMSLLKIRQIIIRKNINLQFLSIIILIRVVLIFTMLIGGCRVCSFGFMEIKLGMKKNEVDSVIAKLDLKVHKPFTALRVPFEKTQVMSLCGKQILQDSIIGYLSDNKSNDSIAYMSLVLTSNNDNLSFVKYLFSGRELLNQATEEAIRIYEIMTLKLGIPNNLNYDSYKKSKLFFLDVSTIPLSIWYCGDITVSVGVSYIMKGDTDGCLKGGVYVPELCIVNNKIWRSYR